MDNVDNDLNSSLFYHIWRLLSFRKENLGHSAKQLIHKKEKENKENQMDLEQE